MMNLVYFLPVWFQAIRGVSAVDSGIRLLPMLLPMVFASIGTGIFVSKVGYYTPPMLVGTCLMTIGVGLLTTLQVDTGSGKWIGYQILYGFGLGMTFQAPNLAAQTVLPKRDVPIGTSLMFFGQLLGGAIFISIGQNVLNNELVKRLSHLPGFNPALLLSEGATTLIQQLPASIRGAVLVGYNESLRQVFYVSLVMCCLVILGAAALEWRSVKKNAPAKQNDAEKGRTEGEETDAGSEKGAREENGAEGTAEVKA
jgi:hypothetical protein